MNFCKRILVFLVILVVSCAPVDQIDPPDVGISPENLDSHIHLVAMYALNSFETNDVIWITIEGTSNQTIELPADCGIRVFLQEDDGWVELDNIMTYEPDAPSYLVPYNNNPANAVTTSLLPRLPDITKKAQVRVYIIGNIMAGGKATDQQVGAYVDLPLTPPEQ